MHRTTPEASVLWAVALMLVPPSAELAAQSAGEATPGAASASKAPLLQREFPDFYDLLVRIERAHGLLYGGLLEEGETVRANGDSLPTFEFEFDMIDRLTMLTAEEGRGDDVAEEAAAGYAVLGEKAARVIAWGNEFYRDVMGSLVDPDVVGFQQQSEAVRKAIARYQSRPEIAMPTVPKDMDILYDHPYALQFRGGYADLDGLIWAGYWLKLAATEPITDRREKAARQEGIDTVTARYHAKLSYGEPPQFFPSELPMAPAISPGLIFLSPEAAIVIDNLSFMHEIFSDIMASPDVPDVHAALAEVLELFLDPEWQATDRDDWEVWALRHGIFFQGGYPLNVMTESELNVGGHAAHFSGGAPPIIGGMPG